MATVVAWERSPFASDEGSVTRVLDLLLDRALGCRPPALVPSALICACIRFNSRKSEVGPCEARCGGLNKKLVSVRDTRQTIQNVRSPAAQFQ